MREILPIQRSKAQARRFYDRISRFYDALTASEKALIKDGLDLLGVQPGEGALEIGCGTGTGLKMMLESSPAACVGLDLSPGMLRQSQGKNSGPDASPQHVQGDAVNLPFPNAAMDAVFMSFTLELFSEADITAVLGECRRVLKPSGRLGVVAMAGRPHTFALRLYKFAHRLFPVAVDCRPIPLVDLLQANGFETITSEKERHWGLPIHLTLSTKHSSELHHHTKEHTRKNA